ncbi:kinesin-related protein 4-like [Vespula maculifrons]|uniref:RING-type E3 ubiquitin transferase n=1 Tax=Vespula maculifrons TaxID=7453 RepID=A0ABD2APL2_VESMC
MATYLKRTSKLFDISLLRSSADVNLRDLMCPVCRGILIEPVTLPCTHNLCLRCLKGTFEHNSLSCPLCRVRVGSWLRTATKSETLVNNALWELIRTKFPKEVEDKYNGDDGEIELNAGLSTRNKILSAAGEIRREYEAQLQMAEEEMRRQRKNEEIASVALIRKIQVEEQQQQFVQIAQDQLLAQSLAKKQLAEKQKEVTMYQNECATSSVSNCSVDTSKFDTKSMPLLNTEIFKFDGPSLETRKMNLSELKNGSELRRSNIALISKIRAERYASSVKPNTSNAYKDSTAKFCCQKSMPVYNTIARTLKHQVVTKFTQPGTSNYALEPGCSTSKIYGMQSKEELRVPSDVLSSKKKSLGVEVCMTSGNGDERIGSAESAGSHDSINQEIHHFKPIKAMPRTPFKMSIDGKQIEPKLVRVIPVLKRISNALPKAPSPTHLKRIIGCSWSAFKGKIRQDMKIKENVCDTRERIDDVEQNPSTSLTQQPNVIVNRSSKSQIHDAIRRLDLVPELSFDSNKNYAKNINRTINGTKVSKKLILDEHVTSGKVQKTWRSQIKNGMMGKSKRQKNIWSNKKDVEFALDEEEMNDNVTNSDPSFNNAKERLECNEHLECNEQEEDSRDNVAVENIAERIKKRKVNIKRKNSQVEQDKIIEADSGDESKPTNKRGIRKRALSRKGNNQTSTSERSAVTVQKRIKLNCSHKPTLRNKSENIKNDVDSLNTSCKTIIHGLRKSSRNIKAVVNNSSKKYDQDVLNKENPNNNKHNYDRLNSCLVSQGTISNNNTNSATIINENVLSNEEVIKEQERIERLVLQEKEDFELAQRLQTKFDEMERIAGRTRRSRKAIESGDISLDLYKIEVGRTVHKVASTHTAKRSTLNQTVSSETKQRGRPRKSVK